MKDKLHSLFDHILEQFYWWLGLLAALAIAFTGSSHLFPEQYQHWVSVAGIAGTAITAYMLRRPPPVDHDDRPDDDPGA